MAYNDETYGNALEAALAKMITRHAVGEMWVGFSMAEKPAGVLLRDASLQSRGLYAGLWQWAQGKGLVVSEAEWQAEYAANGVCHKYSDGDGSTTFRMPSAPLYIKGAENAGEAGAYVAEGLPNITGSITELGHVPNVNYGLSTEGSYFSGALYKSTVASLTNAISTSAQESRSNGFAFDASLSNPIYGASAHVTPATSKLLFGVWAVSTSGVAVPDANAEEILGQVQIVRAEVGELREDLATAGVVGSVIALAANSEPEGYLLCNGAAVSRSTYAALFAAVGTLYGSGDGSTTFALPNLTDRVIQGSGTAGTVKEAGLPNITGSFSKVVSAGYGVSGAFTASGAVTHDLFASANGAVETAVTVGFNASRSNSIYGNSTTVQPPAVTMRYYIKY